jgi:hypothetical protein
MVTSLELSDEFTPNDRNSCLYTTPQFQDTVISRKFDQTIRGLLVVTSSSLVEAIVMDTDNQQIAILRYTRRNLGDQRMISIPSAIGF